MERIELIDLVLRPHQVHATVAGPWSCTDVTVVLPDLRSAPRRVWGDWGPMYAVTVPPDRCVELLVRAPRDAAPAREVVPVRELSVESPIHAAVRAQTPLVLDLPVSSQGVRLLIFYNPRGEPAYAQLAPLSPSGSPLHAVELRAERESWTPRTADGARDATALQVEPS